MSRISLSLFIQISNDNPKCVEHDHPLDQMRNGGKSGYLCVSRKCECSIDAMAYVSSFDFMARTITRLVRENEELKDQLEQAEAELAEERGLP